MRVSWKNAPFVPPSELMSPPPDEMQNEDPSTTVTEPDSDAAASVSAFHAVTNNSLLSGLLPPVRKQAYHPY
jgi:hypothetical protein